MLLDAAVDVMVVRASLGTQQAVQLDIEAQTHSRSCWHQLQVQYESYSVVIVPCDIIQLVEIKYMDKGKENIFQKSLPTKSKPE